MLRDNQRRIVAAVAAGLLAAPVAALAQARPAPQRQGAAGAAAQVGQPQQSAQSGAAAAAQTPQQQQQAAAQQAMTLNSDAQQKLQQLHERNVLAMDFARLGAERGSPKVKELANRVMQDHQRMETELQTIARERGITMQEPQKSWQASLDQMRAMDQASFDKMYAEETAKDRVATVDVLKQLRDSTPGKDARLKGWLDEVENRMEDQRNYARDIRRDVDKEQQRQGRRP